MPAKHAVHIDRACRAASGLGAACTWALALCLAFPQTSEAAPEGRQCAAEPTEMVGYGDLITCAIDPAGDEDVFQFSGGNGEVVRIQIAGTAPGRRACFELFDPEASSVGGIVCANGGADYELGQTGTYTVRVSEADDDDPVPYSLLVERISPTSPTAVRIAFGRAIDDEINAVADLDVFSFEGKTDDTVRIGLSGRADPFHAPCFELFDPEAVPVGDILMDQKKGGSQVTKNSY